MDESMNATVAFGRERRFCRHRYAEFNFHGSLISPRYCVARAATATTTTTAAVAAAAAATANVAAAILFPYRPMGIR